MHIPANTRCANHIHREAVARCPECARYFCRECVTEYKGRVLCTACLQKHFLEQQRTAGGIFSTILRSIPVSLAFVLLWALFYYLGRILISIPDSFHQGTIW